MLAFLLLVAHLAIINVHGAEVDPDVFINLEKGDTVIIVIMESSEHNDRIDAYSQMEESERSDGEYEYLVEELRTLAMSSQAPVLDIIHGNRGDGGYDIEQLWLTNEIVVWNADGDLVQLLSEISGVVSIISDDSDSYNPPEPMPLMEDSVENPTTWSLDMLNIGPFWKNNVTGAGVVVGIISSGVDVQHEALEGKFRSDHGWYDPVNKREAPYDDSDEEIGTRAASVILGGTSKRAVGVAPYAQWMACKAYNKNQFQLSAFKTCLQFMACPTDVQGNNADCSFRPKTLLLTGGFPGSNDDNLDSLLPVMSLLNSAGTFIIWGTGDNPDDNCGLMVQEAQIPFVISVAAVDHEKKRLPWSCRGSRRDGIPDVAAGGAGVYAATSRNSAQKYDNGAQGTHIAAAHIAGLAALLQQVTYGMKPETFEEMLKAHTFPTTPVGDECDGESDQESPDLFVGAGIPNVIATLASAQDDPGSRFMFEFGTNFKIDVSAGDVAGIGGLIAALAPMLG